MTEADVADIDADAITWAERLHDCPTAYLLVALATRPAVEAKFVALEEHETLTVAGPAWVTVNHD